MARPEKAQSKTSKSKGVEIVSVLKGSIHNGTVKEYPIDDRWPIVSEMLNPNFYDSDKIVMMRQCIDHQERVLRAILLGCSKKDFRQTVEHFGFEIKK